MSEHRPDHRDAQSERRDSVNLNMLADLPPIEPRDPHEKWLGIIPIRPSHKSQELLERCTRSQSRQGSLLCFGLDQRQHSLRVKLKKQLRAHFDRLHHSLR